MNNTFRLILGSPGNLKIFFTEQDQDRFLDYARIYKDRFSIKILAYSLKEGAANLLIYDKDEKREKFAKYLSDAYMYYLKLMGREENIRVSYRFYQVESRGDFLELMRFLHCKGRHSLKSYQDFTRYVNDSFLDIGLVLNSFDYGGRSGKEVLLDQIVKEPSAQYQTEFERQEVFKRDKLIKRRERAQKFFDDFLDEMDLDSEEFLQGAYEEEKKRLISRYREETDLSFRDIGYVLGLSHTTVIRIYRDLEHHN